jgi:hypothetical protein
MFLNQSASIMVTGIQLSLLDISESRRLGDLYSLAMFQRPGTGDGAKRNQSILSVIHKEGIVSVIL